jgi:hypothetical protein
MVSLFFLVFTMVFDTFWIWLVCFFCFFWFYTVFFGFPIFFLILHCVFWFSYIFLGFTIVLCGNLVNAHSPFFHFVFVCDVMFVVCWLCF